MSRRPKPGSVVERVDELTREVDRISLKAALGLALSEEELDFVGPIPLKSDFTREEVIVLLGDGAKGVPRMLPVDVALGRLGMPIVRARPDGTAERLRKEFPKAWAAREKADRAIALHVAKTYVEVPKGWFPDRERLAMADVVGPEANAAGVVDLPPGSREFLVDMVPRYRFDLLPDGLRLATYQMWHRRRLAGLVPFECDGLVFGAWDDAFDAYDVPARCFRGPGVAFAAWRAMLVRDVVLSHACDGDWDCPGKVVCREGPHAAYFGCVLGSAMFDLDGVEWPSCGEGLARCYRALAERPGPIWAAGAIRERPETPFDISKHGFRYPRGPVTDEYVARYGPGYVPGAPACPEAMMGWTGRFVSA